MAQLRLGDIRDAAAADPRPQTVLAAEHGMTDVIMVAVIVVFFALSALLVRGLGRVVDDASAEREPEPADMAEVTASCPDNQHS